MSLLRGLSLWLESGRQPSAGLGKCKPEVCVHRQAGGLSHVCALVLLAIPLHAATLDGAHWIWSAEAAKAPAQATPAGIVYFRAAFAVTEQSPVASAELTLTADNLCEAHLNGQPVGGNTDAPDDWNRPRRYDVAKWIKAGHNVLAIAASNTAPGPAGLIARLEVRLADGQVIDLASDTTWKCSTREHENWHLPECNDQEWPIASDAGAFGAPPWGRFAMPAKTIAAGARVQASVAEAPEGFAWPDAILFVGDDCSLYRGVGARGTSADSLSVTIFNPRHSRAYPEHDLPAPMKVGRTLKILRPARPDTAPTILFDAGAGAIGSPSVSFDGRWIYFSMVPQEGSFFHIYKMPADGGAPVRLTDGRFHDIDPVELPDGRIAFTSTRIGTYDEYHAPPSRALFTMTGEGGDIQPLTHTFIFDNEPEVLADGRLLFIRSDNFFDRGKVETMLHAIYPDGSRGVTEFGLDLGPEYGNRLRAFDCGSPAPMPDGRVAYVTGSSIAVGRPGAAPQQIRHLPAPAGDVAALPDGRLLCTLEGVVSLRGGKTGPGFRRIGVVDPDAAEPRVVIVHESDTPLHSPVALAARTRPPVIASTTRPQAATGVLFCQNVRFTKNTTAGWPHVRAVRVLAGKGLTLRSSHSYIVHSGSEVLDLGTVPIAPDGSICVEVPANTAIALQAVDAEGRSELNEMSWNFVRPGETRSCIGCHQPRQSAPPVAAAPNLAARGIPLKLTGLTHALRFRGNNPAVTGLMELQFDRFREVAGINRHDSSVADLIARLTAGTEAERIAAAHRLAVFRDPAAAPGLVAAVSLGSRELRVACLTALSSCGTRESAEALLPVTRDPDPVVRQAARIALENLTGHDGLHTLDWPVIEAELARRVATGDRDTVRRAAVALGHTGRGEEAAAVLRDYLTREGINNPYPEWRKKHSGDNARFNSLDEANPRTLQAVARALGLMKDEAAVPLLAETLSQHCDPATGNLFLAEAVAEALGRIATPAAEEALIRTFAGLKDYIQFTRWYGDHDALMACHASPLHAIIIEALDRNGSTKAGDIVPHLIRSVPTDPDRALMPGNDDYESLVGRVLRRNGKEAAVVDTCLALLGKPDVVKDAGIESALRKVHGAWAGTPGPEIRAAQILSLACADRRHGAAVLAALHRHRANQNTIPRVFDKGIPVVNELPVKNWVCFYLARTLGNLGDPTWVDGLLTALHEAPPEHAGGSPDPLGPGVLFLHNDLTPCWRAEVAWALGRIGDRRAVPDLLSLVADRANVTDTRHAAAVALGRLADDATRAEMARLAEQEPEISTRTALLHP